MKKLWAVGAVALAVCGNAQAQDMIPGEFSTTIGFASEYVFRGISQSDEGPAIQGSIDWSHDSGIYAGIWGSNVEFTDASLETDLYAGYAGDVNGLTYDLGGIYYAYPGADSDLDYDYVEAAVALGYDFDVAALTGAVNYSPDYFGGSGHAVYTAAYLDVPLPFLPFDMALNGNIGNQTVEDEEKFGITEGSYIDYGIGLSATVEGFGLSVKYIDTDLSEPDECADNCDTRVVFALTKSFP